MRLVYGLAFLAVAACGDNNTQGGPVDANHGDGKMGDASVDAPPVNLTSRVWAVGNFITDTKRQVGAFTDGATLPFGNGTPTPIVIPAGTATLPSATTYTLQLFDASADGTKTVYLADAMVAGRYDLYVANAVGGSPTMLVQGSTNVEISSVTISPNGQKVAFTMDSLALDGSYDMYWVSTSGTGSPVKVSPARPLTGVLDYSLLDANSTVFWSGDSRYFGFTGDLTEDTYNQAYVADTTTTNAAAEIVARADIPTSASAQGVFLMAFDSAGLVYFTGRLSMTSTDIQLYRANPDGTNRTDITSLVPLRTDNSTPDIGTMGMSADGTKLAIAADTPTAAHYDIFVNTIGTTTSTNASNFAADWSPNGLVPLAFTRDGMKIGALGKTSTSTRQSAFAIANNSVHRLIDPSASCSGCATPDVVQLAWTTDGSAAYLRGDLTTNNIAKLYRVTAAGTDQTPTLADDSPPAGDVLNVVIRPAAM
jgi:hypothetical protein